MEKYLPSSAIICELAAKNNNIPYLQGYQIHQEVAFHQSNLQSPFHIYHSESPEGCHIQAFHNEQALQDWL